MPPKRKGAAAKARKVVVKPEPIEDREIVVRSAGKDDGLSKRRESATMEPQLGTHTLFLFLGEERKLVTVHTDLLPPATKSLLNDTFADQQVCWLRNKDADIDTLWRAYLYTGKIFSDNETTDQDGRDYGRAESHLDGEWTRLAHAYFFGTSLCDEAFSNACISALIEKVRVTERFPTGIAAEVYQYTQPRDKLRCLLVDLHVWMGAGTCIVPPHEDTEVRGSFCWMLLRRWGRRGLLFLRRGEIVGDGSVCLLCAWLDEAVWVVRYSSWRT